MGTRAAFVTTDPVVYPRKQLFAVQENDGSFRLVRSDTFMNSTGPPFGSVSAGAISVELDVPIPTEVNLSPAGTLTSRTYVFSVPFPLQLAGAIRSQFVINEDGAVGSYTWRVRAAVRRFVNGVLSTTVEQLGVTPFSKVRANDTFPILVTVNIPPTQLNPGDALELTWEYENTVPTAAFSSRVDDILTDPLDLGFEPVFELDW